MTRQPYQTSSPLDHSPGWNEHLASTSEAHVKVGCSPVSSHKAPYSYLPLQADQDRSSPHELASRTVAHLKAKLSVEDGAVASTSRSDPDEVSGPLKSALGTDGIVDIDDTFEEEIKEQEGAWTHKIKREQVKVRRTAFRFVVTFKSNLPYSSLEFEGSVLASNQPSNGDLVDSPRSPFPSVLLVFRSCDSKLAVNL